MRLIHERHYAPFALSLGLAIAITVALWGITHAFDLNLSVANSMYWRLERAAGIMSYSLLATSVFLGLSSAASVWDRWGLRKVMTLTHQYLALLVVPFLFLHLWGLYLDKMVPFSISQLLIPLLSHYRPVSTAFGVVTLYIWVAMIVSSYFRERLGVRTWRMIHRAYLPLFILGTLHGLMAGTDATKSWARALYLVATATFVLLLGGKLRQRQRT